MSVRLNVLSDCGPVSAENTKHIECDRSAPIKRQCVLQLHYMFPHKLDGIFNVSVGTVVDQIIVMIMPPGQAYMIVEQVDDKTGAPPKDEAARQGYSSTKVRP